MIGWLRGRAVFEEVAGQVVVDVGGVGYELSVPLGTLGRARGADGFVELFVHTHVREDALELYGFPNETDRRVFRQLLGVPNIGPRTALAVLSVLPSAELARAVREGDHVSLGRAPGIGKKTAERMVLELKGKLLVDGDAAKSVGPSARTGDARGQLLSALTNMGYRAVEAERAILSLSADIDQTPLSDLLKQALARLG